MQNKPTLTFLIGVPASGKTTYANKFLKNDDTIILSSDDIREEIFKDANNQSNNALVFKTLYERAKQCLSNEKNVVLDSTNTDKNLRKKALEIFKDFNIIKQAIIFETPLEKCIQQDQNRTRKVGENVINKFFNNFSKPTLSEGFDEIKKCKIFVTKMQFFAVLNTKYVHYITKIFVLKFKNLLFFNIKKHIFFNILLHFFAN